MMPLKSSRRLLVQEIIISHRIIKLCRVRIHNRINNNCCCCRRTIGRRRRTQKSSWRSSSTGSRSGIAAGIMTKQPFYCPWREGVLRMVIKNWLDNSRIAVIIRLLSWSWKTRVLLQRLLTQHDRRVKNRRSMGNKGRGKSKVWSRAVVFIRLCRSIMKT